MTNTLTELKPMKEVKVTTLKELKTLVFDTEGDFNVSYHDYSVNLGKGLFMEVYLKYGVVKFFIKSDDRYTKKAISDYLKLNNENVKEIFKVKKGYFSSETETEWEDFISDYEVDTDYTLMKTLDELSEKEVRQMLYSKIK